MLGVESVVVTDVIPGGTDVSKEKPAVEGTGYPGLGRARSALDVLGVSKTTLIYDVESLAM